MLDTITDQLRSVQGGAPMQGVFTENGMLQRVMLSRAQGISGIPDGTLIGQSFGDPMSPDQAQAQLGQQGFMQGQGSQQWGQWPYGWQQQYPGYGYNWWNSWGWA